MFKRTLFFILLLTVLQAENKVSGQKDIKIQNLHTYDLKKIHFGFILGMDEMNFAVKRSRQYNMMDSVMYFNASPEWGFHIGIVSDLRLGEYFNLRYVPTLSFGDRLLQYSIQTNDTVIDTYQKRIESTFLEFPLSLKYKSKRMTNTRVYLIGGPKYSIDLSSLSKKKSEDEALVKLKRNDFTMELGTGFDFYLEYFKFGVEIKMAYGLNDIVYREKNVFTNSIDKIKSKIFYITFTFE